jgi:TetR/AcrR family transcriptional repressor of nem operon
MPLELKDDRSYYVTMSRPKRNDDTRDRLLAVGLSLFSRQGYHGTGIKDITDSAGVPKGSFYNYFESKEDYMADIIRHYGDQATQRWNENLLSAPQSPLATLRHHYETGIANYERSTTRSGCLIGNLAAEISESSELCRDTLRAVMDAPRARFASYLQQAQAAGEARTDLSAEEMADFFWNAWEGSLLRMKIENSAAPVRRCMELMFEHFFKA